MADSVDRKALDSRALHAARMLVDRMRRLYRDLERTTGAPIALNRALVCIANDPGMPASRLAFELGLQASAVSHILRALVERGWAERNRDPADQRSVRLDLTAAGREVLQASSGKALGTMQRAVRSLSIDEVAGLIAGLEALLLRIPEKKAPKQESRASAQPARGPRTRLKTASTARQRGLRASRAG